MKTVKEVAALTGISVRTLHWYDEIGLLRPSACSEAGYRLYDDKAMERLQQILYFREFDLPLKTIRSILDDPSLDTKEIFETQRAMLEQKAARIERLIAGIDGILKGENRMDFTMFRPDELEAIYCAQQKMLTPEIEGAIKAKYGSMQRYHDYFMEQMSSESAQREYRMMEKWYGGREEMLDVMTHPQDSQVTRAYGKRIDEAVAKLILRREEDVHSFAVKEVVGELDFLYKQLFRLRSAREILVRQAHSYEGDSEAAARFDGRYGEGAAAFMAQAIRAFYGKEEPSFLVNEDE